MTPRLKCHLIVIIGTNHGRRRSSDGVTMKCCYPLLGIVGNMERTFQFLLKHSSLFATRLPLFVFRSRKYCRQDVRSFAPVTCTCCCWWLWVGTCDIYGFLGTLTPQFTISKKTYYYEEHFPTNGNVCGKFAGVEEGNNTRHRTLSKESRRGMCKILNWRITSNWEARFCWI